MNRSDPVTALIPAPRSWTPAAGSWRPRDLAGIIGADGDDASFAAGFLAPALGRRLALVRGTGDDRGAYGPAPALSLPADPALADEHYRLHLRGEGLALHAGGRPGLARGLATLLQLCAMAGPDGELPCGTIEDGPAFAWRGLLLDSGRHFQPVETVLGIVDRLAAYKFSVLHWHLTEDQGWRLEVPGLPRLVEVGAWRDQQDGGRHGGFYTAADVRRVVAHAAARGITVVPEIEMPGHSQAALAAYPGLSCAGGPFAVQSQWGIFPDIYCAGREETFAFLEQVLARVLELFPSPFIHVGGDEAPKERWEACPLCRERLASEGLRDAHELQSWFIRRVGRWLAARGRRLVGWDEILEGGLAGSLPGAVVQSWRGVDGAVAAARAGHDTIVSPTSHAYLDYDPGVLDAARVLSFDPVPAALQPHERARVLGGAVNLWTEYAPPPVIDHRLFPRLPAMAEALWSAPGRRDVAAFLARWRAHAPVLAALGARQGPAGRPLRLQAAWNPGTGAHDLRWRPDGALGEALAAAAAGALSVRVAVLPDAGRWDARDRRRPEDLLVPDGAWRPALPAPGAGASFTIAADEAGAADDVIVLAQLLLDGEPAGAPAAIALARHLALGRPATLVGANGAARNAASLCDGMLGSWRHDDGAWLAGDGPQVEVTVDLGRDMEFTLLAARFLQDANAGIFPAREVVIESSADGENWRALAHRGHDLPDRVQDKVIVPFVACLEPVAARWVRLRAQGPAGCPAWHPEAGRPVRLCLDQVVVRR